jgi:hypothetical protein
MDSNKYKNSNGKLPHQEKAQSLVSQQQQSIFHDFYSKLKSDKAAPVRKSIENFVKNTLPKIIKSNCSREE